jgi:hypothetical protein
MFRTFAAALLFATATSFGSAQAMAPMHKHMMMKSCAEGQQAAATCSCGDAMKGHHLLCKKGQWCHSFMHACTK